MMKKIFTIIILLFLNFTIKSQNFKFMPNFLDLKNSNFIFDNELSKICLQNIIQPITDKQNFMENIIGFELISQKRSGFRFILSHFQSPKQAFNMQNASISYSYKIYFTKKILLTPIVNISYETFKYSNSGLKYPSMQSFFTNQIIYEKRLQVKNNFVTISTGFKLGSKSNNVSVLINNIYFSKDKNKTLDIYADFQKEIIKSKDYEFFLFLFGTYFLNTLQIGLMPKLIISNIEIQAGFSYNQSKYTNFSFYINPKIKFENFIFSFSYSNANKSHNNGVFELGIYFFMKRKHKSY